MTKTGKEVAALQERVEALEKALLEMQAGGAGTSGEMAQLRADVNALREAAGAEKELPKTTSADNGKVLGVVKGKWAKMKLPE